MIRLHATLFATLFLLYSLPVQARDAVSAKGGVVLRTLDKITGKTSDVELAPKQAIRLGGLSIALAECRYPRGNPKKDAFAFLAVRQQAQEKPVFFGWMIASAPELSAMDHPLYDVWVLRCIP